jgi:hypothetical protein
MKQRMKRPESHKIKILIENIIWMQIIIIYLKIENIFVLLLL